MLGHGPHKGTQFPGHGNHDVMGIFTFGHQVARPFAEPNLGLPPEGMDRGGELLQTQLEMPTDFGRIPVGPGPCDEGATGMGIARLGQTALLTPRPTGIFRGREPQIMHELSGVIDARQVAQFRHGGHRHRARDTTQGLEGLDDRREAPGLHRLVACVFQTPQTFSLCSDGLDVCLKDNWRRGCGTDDLAEPAQVGRTPVGPSCRADIVPQQEGFETQFGRLQIAHGLFTCPTQVADGFIIDGGDVDRGEVSRAHEPGPWPGITTVGFDPVTRLFRHQGRGDDPANVALF